LTGCPCSGTDAPVEIPYFDRRSFFIEDQNAQAQETLGFTANFMPFGAVPYSYFVKYQPDVDAALQELREREFRAGRYNPVVPFPFHTAAPAPGAGHRTIREALRAAGADGTRSILDLGRVSKKPQLGTVAPLADEALLLAASPR
jgi:hypothetical protein